MNKYIWLVIILAVIIVVILGILLLVPRAKAPSVEFGIYNLSVKSGQEVSLPIKITGTVNGGGWTGFEGQVGTVELKQGNLLLARAILQATTEWTRLPTSFEANISELLANCSDNNNCVITGDANLVFHNENPSGLPEKDKTFTLPIKIVETSGQSMFLKIFFGDSKIPGTDCNTVFNVIREVSKTSATARAALEELLKGPTNAEKDQGFFTSIPAGSKLNSISIVNGEARADFNSTTESGGGSCSMAARVAQITQTLKQFSTITSVKLSINGRTGDIFQP